MKTLRILASITLIAAIGLVCSAEFQPAPNADDSTSSEPSSAHAARVEGHAKCVDCHKLEVQAWLQTKHATRAFDLLRTADSARQYAEKLGIRPSDIARNSMCTKCHATEQVTLAGHTRAIAGVSCEACHGASGGEDGWLNIHASYGYFGARRENETDEHFALRQSKMDAAGARRSSNVYDLVKRCYECHVVNDEKLAEAGHDHGDRFQLIERMLGEVRHNFLFDESSNHVAATIWTDSFRGEENRTAKGRTRVLFMLGQLADLEVSLRNLATATEENDFTGLMMDRIEDAVELILEDILEEVDADLSVIKTAVEAALTVWETIDDDGFESDQKASILEAAQKVAESAAVFAKRDGSNLSELDELDLFPPGPYQNVFEP